MSEIDVLESKDRFVPYKSNVAKIIAMKLLIVMKEHIGEKKAISQQDLFAEIYNKEYNAKSVEDWLRWDFIKQAMRLCRKHTYCFIVYTKTNSSIYFYVVKDKSDVREFIKFTTTNINKIKEMQQRCYKAVEEKWHLKDWSKVDLKIREVKKKKTLLPFF